MQSPKGCSRVRRHLGGSLEKVKSRNKKKKGDARARKRKSRGKWKEGLFVMNHAGDRSQSLQNGGAMRRIGDQNVHRDEENQSGKSCVGVVIRRSLLIENALKTRLSWFFSAGKSRKKKTEVKRRENLMT